MCKTVSPAKGRGLGKELPESTTSSSTTSETGDGNSNASSNTTTATRTTNASTAVTAVATGSADATTLASTSTSTAGGGRGSATVPRQALSRIDIDINIDDVLRNLIENKTLEHIRNVLGQVKRLEQERDHLQSKVEKLIASHEAELNSKEQQHMELRSKYVSDFSTAVEKAKGEKSETEAENKRLLERMKEADSQRVIAVAKQASQVAEIEALRKQLAGQEKAEKSVRNELSGMQKKLADALKAAADADAALKQRQTVEDKLKNEIATAQKKMQESQNQADRSKKMLDKIRPFVVQLGDATTESLAHEFDTMWTRCLNFVQSVVSENLPNDVLEDKPIWYRLEGQFPRLPLPQSNSACAKSIRAIVIMSVLANALKRYIFTATHLLPEAGELDDLLDELAEKDINHERFVRSVLLRPFADCEAHNTSTRARKVREAVVSSPVASIIPAAKLDVFGSRLESLCQDLARTWTKFQSNKPHFRVSIETNHGIEESAEWRVLKLPVPIIKTNSANAAAATASFTDLLPDDLIAVVIFPQLLSVDQEEDKSIRPAIVATISQLREAEEENRKIRTELMSAARRSSGTSTRPRTRSRPSDVSQSSVPAELNAFLGHT